MSPMLLVGPIAPPEWGPAVRNRIMADYLDGLGVDVALANTLGVKRNPARLLFEIIGRSIRRRRVILSVSRNGRFILVPLLAALTLLFGVRVVFMPAGGLLSHEIRNLPLGLNALFRWAVRRMTLVAVQREELAKEMAALGFTNIVVVPNFKIACPSLPARRAEGTDIRLLFLSRVRPLKGIEQLFAALDELRDRGLRFQLDVIGMVDDSYKDAFQALLETRSYARYGGVLPYNRVIPEIATYDLMIFPTLCETEGFPGVLADAAMAGLPVVASNVACNRELIRTGENGLLACAGDSSDLAAKIEVLARNPELRASMGERNREYGKQYSADVVLTNLFERLEARGW